LEANTTARKHMFRLYINNNYRTFLKHNNSNSAYFVLFVRSFEEYAPINSLEQTNGFPQKSVLTLSYMAQKYALKLQLKNNCISLRDVERWYLHQHM